MLTPTPEGLLRSDRALPTAFVAPRLQGEHRPGGVLDVALWGAGDLGRLRFTPMAGPFRYGPNGVEGRESALRVARSAPALVLRRCGFREFSAARRCASWDPGETVATVTADGDRRTWSLPWGATAVETRGSDLVVAAGADRAELDRALRLPVEAIVAEAEAHAAACDRLPEADPLLRSMVRFGAHAALAHAREDAHGRFAGLSAGPAYSAPARSYYRDGYWTTPLLLQAAPELVRAQIDLLARGVRADGEAPSAVLVGAPGQREAWERFRARSADAAAWGPDDWWSDHFDSPLLFVLMVDDYLSATGDASAAAEHAGLIRAVFERYERLGRPGDGLPLKPRHDRDWADNVFREGLVAYDLGLWFGMLRAVARLLRERAPAVAHRALEEAEAAHPALDRALWRGEGVYADYAAPDGFSEDHLALDSLTLLRFGAVTHDRADAVLGAVRERLETDWGVRCAWPPYRRRSDLRAKSAFPGRYHNGGDWPWLDGLYADALLRRGRYGWRAPLLRWWAFSLEQGWTSPVEWFSPAWGRGSLLQAWSSLPAAVALKHRAAVLQPQADWNVMAAPFMQ